VTENFDWSLIVKDVSIGGVAVYALYLFYKSFIFFNERWKESTEVINRNTETHKAFTEFFQTFYEENKQYQQESLDILKDTHKKVTDIHNDMKGRENNGSPN